MKLFIVVAIGLAAIVCIASPLGSGEAGETSLDVETRYQLEADRLRLTRREMELVAIAIEDFSMGYGQYPRQPTVSTNLARLREHLVPRFLTQIPSRDAWCSPYVYWSDGFHYMIVSGGSDRKMDRDYGSLETLGDVEQIRKRYCGGASKNAESDIVWLDGNFCQWSWTNAVERMPNVD